MVVSVNYCLYLRIGNLVVGLGICKFGVRIWVVYYGEKLYVCMRFLFYMKIWVKNEIILYFIRVFMYFMVNKIVYFVLFDFFLLRDNCYLWFGND